MAIKFDNDTFSLVPQEFVMPRFGRRRVQRAEVSPIEDAGAELAAELRRVGWEVPGLDLEFASYGRGTAVIRKLRSVSGETEEGPFRLHFDGATGEMRGDSNVVTQLSHAVVPPGIDAHYFSDGSGPRVDLMVRGEWKDDGADFMGRLRVNSKLNGEPKTYLRYGGRGQGGGRAATLAHDHDLWREYSPEGAEPVSLDAAHVAGLVNAFVSGLVDRLRAMPSAPGHDDVTVEGDANLRRLAAVDRVPVPAGFPTLYVRLERNDAWQAARLPGGDVEPERDFVLSGTGWRLVSLGNGAGEMHPRATDGFCYATTDPSSPRGHVGYGKPLSETVAVEVRPTCLNDIFVVDNAVHARARAEAAERATAAGRDEFTSAEMRGIAQAYAATMVAAADYDGSYEEPLYLIGRQMGTDEARVMRGPIRVARSGEGLVTVMRDSVTDEPVVLFESDDASLWALRQAVRSARDASETVGGRVTVDADVEEALAIREAAHRERIADDRPRIAGV